MHFDWAGFWIYTGLGLAGAAVMYVGTRWGGLNRRGQYDPETVATFAWRIALGFAAVPVALNLLFQFGVLR